MAKITQAERIEERLMGMKAVEKRFITEKQLIQCMNIVENFETDKTLEEKLIEKGYLTRAQIARLKKSMLSDIDLDSKPRTNTTKKKMFGNIALEQNMIDEDQLIDALEEQEIYMERGVRVQMGQILLKKQYLTRAQLERILSNQSKKTLACPKCKATKIVHNYNDSKFYQCENIIGDTVCGFDLVVAKQPKKAAPVRKSRPQSREDDGGVGKLVEIKL